MAADALPLGLDPLIAEAKERARNRRLATVGGVLAVVGLACVLAVKLSGGAGQTVRVAGISARVPAGWFVTRRPLNSITDPVQRFVVSSFPIAPSDFRSGNDFFRPPATGVLVKLDEWRPAGGPGFSPRPARLRLGPFRRMEIFPGRRWTELTFKLGGRDFYAFVWIGRRAPVIGKWQALSILEGMHA